MDIAREKTSLCLHPSVRLVALSSIRQQSLGVRDLDVKGPRGHVIVFSGIEFLEAVTSVLLVHSVAQCTVPLASAMRWDIDPDDTSTLVP